ncbi:MAG TPA: ABC-F family ATP-binding cassette domain-containing protein [Candidatus Paceibacterota bacterium]
MNQPKRQRPFIIANDISFEVGSGVSVFKNLSLSLSGEKTGLVGRNGVGKTTLLRILEGELEPTEGKVQRAGVIAYLPQDYQLDLSQTVAEVLDAKNAQELNMQNLGPGRQLSSLSGGERARIALAKLLLSDPDFIILDEPTNNLDHSSREDIYNLVRNWKGGLLVVSHDRDLLNLMDQILELSKQGLKTYGGNHESYKKQKEVESEAAKKQLVNAKKELKKTKKQAQKTKEKQQKRSSQGKKMRDKIGLPKIILGMMKEASQTTSARLQALHKERVEGAASNVERAKERISPENQIHVDLSGTVVPAGKLIIEMKNVSFSYEGGKNLFQGFNLKLHGPVRVALNGPNGSGKTTLIRLMLDEIRPSDGEISLGVDKFAYLDQGAAILSQDKTLIENLKSVSGLEDAAARKWLGRFLFPDQDVFKKVGALSGGERMRAALACVLAGDEPPNLLVLDEPTNNLDLDSIEQIESVLLNFRGALIVISHDKSFLKNIGIKDEVNLL